MEKWDAMRITVEDLRLILDHFPDDCEIVLSNGGVASYLLEKDVYMHDKDTVILNSSDQIYEL